MYNKTKKTKCSLLLSKCLISVELNVQLQKKCFSVCFLYVSKFKELNLVFNGCLLELQDVERGQNTDFSLFE